MSANDGLNRLTWISQQIAGCAEVCGHALSASALEMLVEEAENYSGQAISKAVRACMISGRFNFLSLLMDQDGHPSPDEAWAMLPFDEGATVVWTEPMSKAWGLASALFYEGDKFGARMAFRDAYAREVANARESKTAPHWTPSLGHDKDAREGALRRAVDAGRITKDYSQSLLPAPKPTAEGALMIELAASLMFNPMEKSEREQGIEKIQALKALMANRKKAA